MAGRRMSIGTVGAHGRDRDRRRRSLRPVASAAMVVLAGTALSAVDLAAQSPIRWHGYAQLRYARTDPDTGFSVRRAKLWLNGPVPDVSHLAFRVQGIFRSSASGAFVLQDFFVQYGGRRASLRVGQFVPAFSLQRSQPDYLLPLIERASVVETLVPGARTMGRDIGVQASVTPGSGAVNLAAGLFDGSGANRASGKSGDFLATGRMTLSGRVVSGLRGSLGGSLAWRSTHGTDVGALSTEGSSFAGHGFRWGTDARVVGAGWEIQGEYIRADLGGEISHGYYVLGGLDLSARNEVAVSVEKVSTAAAGGSSEPWYIAGFTHVLGGALARTPGGQSAKPALNGPMPTKVMADVRFRVVDGAAIFGAAVQLQAFVH